MYNEKDGEKSVIKCLMILRDRARERRNWNEAAEIYLRYDTDIFPFLALNLILRRRVDLYKTQPCTWFFTIWKFRIKY